ncbi:GNAT family N-acetyltransferase [Pacificibacter marinus]|uniref:GNAT family N-acetyltransferase n=1 Tax=Pacificibacter marinus TaxID=658057 RepID=UPI001C0710A3|nr:GNAT family N-acetyltransferase [Pacificibacter marinus]MBU2868886.1 GNAT family N-acetyltransferase [Pacificibacter marinus]
MCLLQERPLSENDSLSLSTKPRNVLPPFVVRTATPADALAIDGLIAASYGALMRPVYHDDILSRALPRLMRTAPSLLSGGSYFVADAGGALLGAGGWSQATPFGGVGPATNGHMRRVAVLPHVIRSGVGSLIVDHALAHARTQGVESMFCLSTLAAEDFYKAKGFDATGEVELTLEPGLYLPAIQMRRALN